MGFDVGTFVGAFVGRFVGARVGGRVGVKVGLWVGFWVGLRVGLMVGSAVGIDVWVVVGRGLIVGSGGVVGGLKSILSLMGEAGPSTKKTLVPGFMRKKPSLSAKELGCLGIPRIKAPSG